MSNLLLWILALTTMLLFAGAMTAAGARSTSRIRAGLLFSLSWLVSALALATALVFVGMAAHFFGVYRPYFYGVVALAVGFVIGLSAIRWCGRRASERDAVSRWPVGGLLVATLVSFALLTMTLWNLDLQTRLRLEGYRTQAATLLLSTAPPHVSDRLNAARTYERAFVMLKADETLKNTEVLDTHGDPQSEEAQGILKRHSEALALIRMAAEMPECRFDYDYSYPSVELMLPDLSRARQAANLLALAARSNAANGRADAAMSDVQRLYGLSGHVADDPMLVSHLVSIGINALAHESLAQVLPRVTEVRQLDALVLPSTGMNIRRAQRALMSERAFGLACICDMAAGRLPMGVASVFGSGTSQQLSESLALVRLFFVEQDIEGYLRFMNTASSLLNKPYYQTSAERDAMAAYGNPETTPGIFTSILTPSLQNYLAAITQAQAHDVIANVGVAFTRFRLEHSRYPQTLEESGVAAVDPFDGKPIRTRMTDEGLIIYSVGRDLKDDGGIIDPPTRKGPADLGLILRTRPATPQTTETAQ